MRLFWGLVGLAVLLGVVWLLLPLPFGALDFVTVIAVLLAVAIVLLARSGLRRSPEIQREETEFAAYPEGRVLAVFDHAAEAEDARREVTSTQGVDPDDVVVFAGRAGAATLDAEGSAHGIAATIERELEHLISDEDDLAEYEGAVRQGRIVIAVPAPAEQERERLAAILERHHGHRVRYFGRWTVETLDTEGTPRRPAQG